MKRAGFIFVLMLALSSCLTVGRIERNCDKFAKICLQDQVTVITYRDTTIFRVDTLRVPLPYRDTVRIHDTVKIVDNLAYMPLVRRRFGLVGVDAWVNKSVLGVKGYLTDSTILHAHRDTITLEKVIKEQATIQTVTVKHVPGFYRFTFWFFWAVVAVAVFAAVRGFLAFSSIIYDIFK